MSWNELSAILGLKIEAISFNSVPMRCCKRTKKVAGLTGHLALASEIEKCNLKGSFTKACADIFGLPHGAEPGQINYDEWLDAIHPDDRARAHEAATAAQDPSGDGVYDIELRIRHPDGSVRWATAKGKMYFTDDAVATGK